MTEASPTTSENRQALDVAALVASAAEWMGRAVRAWASSDQTLVTVAAPLAVEQLGKAVLWKTNPLLALPLGPNREDLFVRVAKNPSLADPALRTVGLGEVLSRVKKLVGVWPLNDAAAKDLKDARDGAVHVGTATAVRPEQLARHAITACDRLLEELNVEPENFFDPDDLDLVETLRKHYRTEVEERVQIKKAKAAHHLEQLRRAAGEQYDEVVASRESQAADRLRFKLSADGDLVGVPETCPVCESVGRLYGRLDIDFEVDYDEESMGGGRYEPIPYTYPVAHLVPQVFGCNVCNLRLDGTDELDRGPVESDVRRVEAQELDEDIDIADWAPTAADVFSEEF